MSYNKEYLYKNIVGAKQYLDKSFNEEINIDILAKQANISKFHFIRLFKLIYKITPHQYLTVKRIKMAKRELEKPNQSVSDVCHKVGFNSVSSFCNLFKKTTNQTPLEYRSSIMELKESQMNTPLNNIPGCYALMHQ